MILLIAVGCGADAPAPIGPDPDIGQTIAGQPCSELAATLNGWLGKPTLCQRGPDMRELLAIGDGFILDWTGRTHDGRIWSLGHDNDPPLGSGPITGGPSPGLTPRTTLLPVGKRRLLLLQSDKPNAQIFTVNPSAPPGANTLFPTLGETVLEEGASGHGFVSLDDDDFLDYRTGTGIYNVHHIDETARDTNNVIVGTAYHGTNLALRRGARVVNLGQNRLLEWVPVTGAYRVWRFTLQPGRAEIFDDAPVSSGVFADLTPNHEIVVPAPDRILIWQRNSGHIQLRVLDPTADDPLSGALVGESTELLLRSPDWTAPTSSAIQNVVLVLQQVGSPGTELEFAL